MSTSATIRVAHPVNTWLQQTETWLHTQVSFTPGSVESHVFCERTANLEQFALPNLHVMESPWLPLQVAARMARLRHFPRIEARECRRLGIDLLHSHFGNRAWRDNPLARRLGIPHVATFYGFDVNMLPTQSRTWRRRYLDLFAHVDLVLGEGPFMVRALQELGCPATKTRVQHLGVDIDRIPFRPRHWDGNSRLKVMIASSFLEKKGIPDAIHALAAALPARDIELTLIGDAGRDPRSQVEKQDILAALATSGLAPATRLMGYVRHDRMLELAGQQHVFIAASKTARDGDTEGGAPVALVEMAASGIPIVATTHADIPNVVIDDSSGWLAAPGSVEGIAAAIRRCVDAVPSWPQVLEAGRARMEAEFNATLQGRRLAALYSGLVESRR